MRPVGTERAEDRRGAACGALAARYGRRVAAPPAAARGRANRRRRAVDGLRARLHRRGRPAGGADRVLQTPLQAHGRGCRLPPVTIHGLRHSVATILIESQGLHPAHVTASLGHADIATTLRLYSHAMPSLARTASDAFDKLISGQPAELSSELSSSGSEHTEAGTVSDSLN